MALKKVSALVELTAPAVGDLLLITDISEAADANKSKKITFANLVDLAAKVSGLPTITTFVATDLLLAIRGGVAYQLAQSNAGQVRVTNRQGGSATEWITVGTTNYVPAAVKIQVGAFLVNPGGSWQDQSTAITYPVAFSANPIVFTTVWNYSLALASVNAPSASGFNAYVHKLAADSSSIYVNWMAIGSA